MLHADHRWQLTKLLDKAEKQRLFDEHVTALTRRNRALFRRVIDEFVNPVDLMTISWRDVRRLIKEDPRFSKFSSSDRVRVLFFLFFWSCLLYYLAAVFPCEPGLASSPLGPPPPFPEENL